MNAVKRPIYEMLKQGDLYNRQKAFECTGSLLFDY